MTNVNNAENNQTDKLNHKQNKKPTKKLIHSFNKLFNKAQIDTENDNESTILKSTKNDMQQNQSFEYDQNDNLFQHFFPELGISQIKHIEKMIITIANAIEKVHATQTNETFKILLDNSPHPFQIDLLRKSTGSNLSIKLTGDETLCNVLRTYLPELKNYLRKKSIQFDDILIEEDPQLELEKEVRGN